MKIRLFTLFFLFPLFTFAQKVNIDSLRNVWQDESRPDTIRMKALDDLAWDGYLFTNPDSAFYFAQMEYDFAKKKNNKKFQGRALATQAYSLGAKGENEKAIEYNMRSLKIREEIHDVQGMAGCYNNVGTVYSSLGNFSKAIDYFRKSLKILEDLKNYKGMVGALDNIGTLYYYQKNYDKALEFENKSLKIAEDIGDKEDMQYTLSNLGIIYLDLNENDRAIDFYKRSYKISEDLGYKSLMSTALSNIGLAYFIKGDNKQALEYDERSLKIAEEIGDRGNMSMIMTNLGNIYRVQGDNSKAIDCGKRALAIAKDIIEVPKIREASNSLYLSYKKAGKFQDALIMHELYIAMSDSISSENSKKEVVRQEFKYEYDKKVAADSIKEMEGKKIIALQFQNEQTKRYVLYGGILVLFIFGGFMFNRFRVTQKQKNVIHLQKVVVEEKQKEILDSIKYAKRIQNALLPTERYIEKSIKRLKKN